MVNGSVLGAFENAAKNVSSTDFLKQQTPLTSFQYLGDFFSRRETCFTLIIVKIPNSNGK